MKPTVVIITTTSYKGINETRFSFAKELVASAGKAMIPINIVDASPVPLIRDTFMRLGANVAMQSGKTMGAARRQAIDVALCHLPTHLHSNTIMVWTEPEKYGVVECIPHIIAPIAEGRADVVIAGRSEAGWKSYPEFQVISEGIGNLVFREVTGIEGADIMHGPIAFTPEYAERYLLSQSLYLAHGVKDTYIQHYLPMLAKADGKRVECVTIDLCYPAAQKAEEEGSLAMEMAKKRLSQLNQLTRDYYTLGRAKELVL